MLATSTLWSLAEFDLQDESNVRIPRAADGRPLSTKERLRLVELKLGGSTNWARDPFFGSNPLEASACRNQTYLCDDGKPINRRFDKCDPGNYDHPICLDDVLWAMTSTPGVSQPCIVYDFGIRQQPHFGMALAKSFGCEVHAFDPSPISVEWYLEQKRKGALPLNYHFHRFGAGGIDGYVKLQEYNWGQVSILRLPELMKNCSDVPKDERVYTTPCKTHYVPHKSFRLKVQTLGNIMRTLGHTRIDVLKVDVEGSEYAFLEDAIDTGAMHAVQQLALEWHHFPFDQRYGAGSSPPLNALTTVLSALGLQCWWVHNTGGWPALDAVYEWTHMHDVRYNLASFRRVRRAPMRGRIG